MVVRQPRIFFELRVDFQLSCAFSDKPSQKSGQLGVRGPERWRSIDDPSQEKYVFLLDCRPSTGLLAPYQKEQSLERGICIVATLTARSIELQSVCNGQRYQLSGRERVVVQRKEIGPWRGIVGNPDQCCGEAAK